MRLSITTEAGRAQESLVERALAAESIEPIADQILEVVRGASARQFASGAGWARSQKASGLTLVDEGNLRDSLTRAGGNARTTIRSDEVLLESREASGRYLAAGARGMPVRDPSHVEAWRIERDAGQVLVDYIAGERR